MWADGRKSEHCEREDCLTKASCRMTWRRLLLIPQIAREQDAKGKLPEQWGGLSARFMFAWVGLQHACAWLRDFQCGCPLRSQRNSSATRVLSLCLDSYYRGIIFSFMTFHSFCIQRYFHSASPLFRSSNSQAWSLIYVVSMSGEAPVRVWSLPGICATNQLLNYSVLQEILR